MTLNKKLTKCRMSEIKHDLMVPAIPALSQRTTSRQSPSVLNLNIIHKHRSVKDLALKFFSRLSLMVS